MQGLAVAQLLSRPEEAREVHAFSGTTLLVRLSKKWPPQLVGMIPWLWTHVGASSNGAAVTCCTSHCFPAEVLWRFGTDRKVVLWRRVSVDVCHHSSSAFIAQLVHRDVHAQDGCASGGMAPRSQRCVLGSRGLPHMAMRKRSLKWWTLAAQSLWLG